MLRIMLFFMSQSVFLSVLIHTDARVFVAGQLNLNKSRAKHNEFHSSPRTSVSQRHGRKYSAMAVGERVKRLRYYIQRVGAVLNMVRRIFLRGIAQSLQSNSPDAVNVDRGPSLGPSQAPA